MYPTYALEVRGEDGWQIVDGTEASSRPHHYDTLRAEFDKLVNAAHPYTAHFVQEFAIRISSNGQAVDIWAAH